MSSIRERPEDVTTMSMDPKVNRQLFELDLLMGA